MPDKPRLRINWFRLLLLTFIAVLYVAGIVIATQTVLNVADMFAWQIGAFTAIVLLLIDSR